jgi:hypothetical protein
MISLRDKIIPNAISPYKIGSEKQVGQEAQWAPFLNGSPLKVARPSPIRIRILKI